MTINTDLLGRWIADSKIARYRLRRVATQGLPGLRVRIDSCQIANSFCSTFESRNGCDAPWQTLLLQLATPMCLLDSIALTADGAAFTKAGNSASNSMAIKARLQRFIAFLPVAIQSDSRSGHHPRINYAPHRVQFPRRPVPRCPSPAWMGARQGSRPGKLPLPAIKPARRPAKWSSALGRSPGNRLRIRPVPDASPHARRFDRLDPARVGRQFGFVGPQHAKACSREGTGSHRALRLLGTIHRQTQIALPSGHGQVDIG